MCIRKMLWHPSCWKFAFVRMCVECCFSDVLDVLLSLWFYIMLEYYRHPFNTYFCRKSHLSNLALQKSNTGVTLGPSTVAEPYHEYFTEVSKVASLHEHFNHRCTDVADGVRPWCCTASSWDCQELLKNFSDKKVKIKMLVLQADSKTPKNGNTAWGGNRVVTKGNKLRLASTANND